MENPKESLSTISKGHLKSIDSKTICPNHNQKYDYYCEYPKCEVPFACRTVDCIQQHFHEGKASLIQFSSEEFQKKLHFVNDNVYAYNAQILKGFIEKLTTSLSSIQKQMKSLQANNRYLKVNMNEPLNNSYISKINESYDIGLSIHKKINEIKSKLSIQFLQKDTCFYLRNNLNVFLQDNIPDFNWHKTLQVYSSKDQKITMRAFHEKLSKKQHLVFIFIGDHKIVGSYYPSSYPTLTQISKKDLNSFLFIIEEQQSFRFYAQPQADHHIYVSQNNYICHGNKMSNGDGIITFKKGLEEIQYYLPSHSYQLDNKKCHTIFHQSIKINKFMILQLNKQNIKHVGTSCIGVCYF